LTVLNDNDIIITVEGVNTPTVISFMKV